MRCPKHNLAAAPDGKCVRCRREEEEAAGAQPGAAAPMRRGVVTLLVLAGVVCAGVVVVALRPHGDAPPPPPPSMTPSTVVSAPPLDPLAPASVRPDPTPPAPAASGETALDRAMHTVVVTLYCRPNVPECALARTWLLDRHYVYKEHNVDVEREASAALRAFAPDGKVPGFDVDGQGFAGFDAARLQEALAYAGAKRLQR